MKITLIDPLLVDESILRKHREKLEHLGHEFNYYEKSAENEEEIIQRAKGSEILMITNKKLPDKVFEDDRLKMIDIAFTGFDHVNTKLAQQKGVKVLNASGYSNTSVAELAVGMAISILRKFKENEKNIFESEDNDLLGETLNQKTVGIVGTGKIGVETLKLFKAFGCNIIAYSRTQKEEVKSLGVEYVTLDEIFKNSDIISLHLPFNEQTKKLISKEYLDLMNENQILINCARGGVVDNDYIAKILNEGKIRAFGVDVFDMEPPLPFDYPLRNAKNVLLTNHVAYLTKEAMINRADIVFDNLYKYLDGVIQNEVI